VACRRKRIAAHGRMHQRIDELAERCENSHLTRSARPGGRTRFPDLVAGSCQSPLKRTLRQLRSGTGAALGGGAKRSAFEAFPQAIGHARGGRPCRARRGAFAPHGERQVHAAPSSW
jgi:hypothetical protein